MNEESELFRAPHDICYVYFYSLLICPISHVAMCFNHCRFSILNCQLYLRGMNNDQLKDIRGRVEALGRYL